MAPHDLEILVQIKACYHFESTLIDHLLTRLFLVKTIMCTLGKITLTSEFVNTGQGL